MNTFAVIHSGFKNVDSTGSSGPIRCQKAQKLIDDYMSAVRRVAHPDEVDGEHEHMEGEGDMEDESQQVHEQELNGKVLYDLSGGTSHGRFATANGAVRAADIRAAAKENNIRPSKSVSMQSMAREVAHPRSENTMLQQEKDNVGKAALGLIVRLYRRVGEEVPEEALSILSATQPSIFPGGVIFSGGLTSTWKRISLMVHFRQGNHHLQGKTYFPDGKQSTGKIGTKIGTDRKK